MARINYRHNGINFRKLLAHDLPFSSYIKTHLGMEVSHANVCYIGFLKYFNTYIIGFDGAGGRDGGMVIIAEALDGGSRLRPVGCLCMTPIPFFGPTGMFDHVTLTNKRGHLQHVLGKNGDVRIPVTIV
jgi:hypothetical protein